MPKLKTRKFEIYPGVELGKDVYIESSCVIGKPLRNRAPAELKTIIKDKAVIRSGTVIYAGTVIGRNFQTGHNVLIREGNIIGDDVSIGSNSTIEPDNKIGNHVRIHSSCFMESVTIEDSVFIGPGVVFTDDLHPPCPRYKDCTGGARVKKFAKIGANSTILPGVLIGENALIGSGSVVIKDVPKNSVVAGNPAKKIKSVKDLICFKGFFKKPYEFRDK